MKPLVKPIVKGLDNARLRVLIDTEEILNTSLPKGKFTTALSYDEVYTLEFICDGYVSKRIVTDTRDVPSIEIGQHHNFENMLVTLAPETATDITSPNAAPVAYIYYDPASYEFTFDENHFRAPESAEDTSKKGLLHLGIGSEIKKMGSSAITHMEGKRIKERTKYLEEISELENKNDSLHVRIGALMEMIRRTEARSDRYIQKVSNQLQDARAKIDSQQTNFEEEIKNIESAQSIDLEMQELQALKANAKTKEDTLAIALREAELLQAKTKLLEVEKLNEDALLQVAMKEAEVEERRLYNYLLFAGIAFVLLVAIMLWRNLSHKKKTNTRIIKQKDAIQRQRDIVAEKNKEITDSILYAKRIQSAILPPAKLVEEALPNSFVLFKPKDIVAGDFYWMQKIDDTVYFCAADCTGHGVPGAMVSVICSNALTKSVKEIGLREPAKILDKATTILEEQFHTSTEAVTDGMDLALCALNLKTNELQYAGANNPLWIMKPTGETIEEALVEIKADKQPVGHFGYRKAFTNHTVQLEQGDTVYSFSDGFADQFGGPKGKKYKYKTFKNYLKEINGSEMNDVMSQLDTEFEDWRGELEQVDDVCIIGVRV